MVLVAPVEGLRGESVSAPCGSGGIGMLLVTDPGHLGNADYLVLLLLGADQGAEKA